MSGAAPKRSRARRALLILAGLVIVLALGAGIALLTGIPQRRIAEHFAVKSLGMPVRFTNLQVGRWITADEVAISEGGGSIVLQGLKADARWRGLEGRYVGPVSIERIEANLAPEMLARFSGGEDAPGAAPDFASVLAYLPMSLSIASAHIALVESGAPRNVGELALNAEIPSAEQISGHAEWRGAPPRAVSGGIDFKLKKQGETIAASLQADIPGAAKVDGTLRYAAGAAGQPARFDFVTATAEVSGGELMAWASRALGVEFTFERLALLRASGAFTLAEGAPVPAHLSLEGDVSALQVGPVDAPWMAGSLHLVAEMPEGENRLVVDVQPAEGPHATANIVRDSETSWHGEFDSGAWDVAALQKLVPMAGTYTGLLPSLNKLHATGTMAFVEGVYSGNGTVDTGFAGAAEALSGKIAIALDKPATAGAEQLFTIEWPGKAGTVTATSTLKDLKPGAVSLSLKETALSPWYALLYGTALPGGWGATVMGAMNLTPSADEKYALSGSGDIALDPPGKGEKASGKISIRAEDCFGEQVSPVALTLDLGDSGKLSIEEGAILQGDAASMNLPFRFEGDLEVWAGLMGLEDISGAATAKGTIQQGASGLAVKSLNASIESLEVASWRMPYNSQTTLACGLSFAPDFSSMTSDALKISLTEATQAELGGLKANAANSGWSATIAEVKLNSDLKLLVDKQWLAEAKGASLELTIKKATWKDGALNGSVSAKMDAAILTLPNTLSTLTGVHAEAEGEVKGGLTGKVAVESILTAGTTMSGFASGATLDGLHVRLGDIRTAIFGGSVTGAAEAFVDEEGPGAKLDLNVTGLDLARFTEEFKPPKVRLTGIAGGTVVAGLRADSITALDVNLQAPETVTVNREVVEELVRAQGLAGMQQNVADKVLKKFLGDEPQRPFDSGSLTAGLSDGRITGLTSLVSKDLKLSADIKADPGAITAAMRARAEEAPGQ